MNKIFGWYFHNNHWKQCILNNKLNSIVTIQDVKTNNLLEIEENNFLIKNNTNDKEILNLHNLINLVHLHEASILNYLVTRYHNDIIYTFTGEILIAINPFKQIQNLYNNQTISYYKNNNIKKISPHIFTIAKNAFSQMITNNKNQSVLISGESGSGKTVTAKFIMKYLTYENEKITDIEEKILSSNPILEAFGNAKTVRNDNSSRFGKFIKLYYDCNNNIKCGIINKYLLEQIRIVNVAKNERNYHIFYMMLVGLSDEKKKNLLLKDFNYYSILNNTNKERDDNISDYDEFINFEKRMNYFFTTLEINEIYQLLSSILLLGNCKVFGNNETNAIEFVNYEDITNICKLLNLDENYFKQYLFYRTMITTNESYTINLNSDQINSTIQGITKFIYSELFNFIVKRINSCINDNRVNENSQFIGILDIFGFEVFKHNYYEQLLINFTNEILQQQFNYFVFKKEQELYKKEQINWQSITFPDNHKIINLFMKKSVGLFNILNDCCQMNKNYKNFYQQILKKCENNDTVIQFTSKLKANEKFIVKHYASDVTYNCKNICFKNKHPLHNEIKLLFGKINLNIWKNNIWINKNNLSSTKNKIKQSTVFEKFNKQLTNLMTLIKQTETHYIRCIKPNDNNKPNNIDEPRVIEQLKYSGVLQAIKIARLGYPIRFKHNEFHLHYNSYLHSKLH